MKKIFFLLFVLMVSNKTLSVHYTSSQSTEDESLPVSTTESGLRNDFVTLYDLLYFGLFKSDDKKYTSIMHYLCTQLSANKNLAPSELSQAKTNLEKLRAMLQREDQTKQMKSPLVQGEQTLASVIQGTLDPLAKKIADYLEQ